MRYLNQVAEVYRIDTEEEVKNFIESVKADALDEGYILKSCAYTLKEKKKLENLLTKNIINFICSCVEI